MATNAAVAVRGRPVALPAGGVALLCLFLAACGPSPAKFHPRSALTRYAHAIETDNPRAAYELLSKKIRKDLSFPAFERKWKKNHRELRIQAQAIRERLGKEKHYKVSATIRAGKRRSVALSYDGERWRIRGGVGAGFDSLTPKEAILALVRALESKNFPAFLKLLGKQRREKFLRALNLRLEKLRANLDREFEITGNRARLQYDPQYWIMLVKENGIWRVVEFN